MLLEGEVEGAEQCDVSFEGKQINQCQWEHMEHDLEQGIFVCLCTILLRLGQLK